MIQKMLDNAEKHPVLGFNNANPSPDRKEYGYELWIRIDPETEPEGEIEVKSFLGGLYAVTTCKLLEDPKGNVAEVWMKLWDWVQASQYEWRKVHELEKQHDPNAMAEELVLDLYLPIAEGSI